MNPTHPQIQNPAARRLPVSLAAAVGLSLLALAGSPSSSLAQSSWTGSADTDWNNAANWSAGVPSAVNAVITNISGNICVVTSTISATPVDILVGTGGGAVGRVDHRAGDVVTGDGNWLILGWQGGQATYNWADTAATGGTLTGFGLGSGNINVGGSLFNGNVILAADAGTVATMNINSSGTLTGAGMFIGCNGLSTATVNMDAGIVNLSGECQVGSSFWGNGNIGRFNLGGGNFTANIFSVGRGNNNSAAITGTANITGGTLNSMQWFTLGFAGSSSLLAAVTNNGGTININTTGGGNLEMGVWDPANTRFVVNSGAVTVQNNASILFGVLGQSGTGTFEQNGGTVAFYMDAGTTLGGSGGIVLGSQGANPWEISTGTFNYNLNGGTLTVPQISKLSAPATGNFNFNGGTLKPTTTTATFLQGLTAGNIQGGGAKIDTDGFDVTIAQGLVGTGVLSKLGLGTLTLSGTNIYTGNTVISNGTLALSGTATLASQVIIPASRTLDVTALSVGLQNPVAGVGAVNGSATAAVGMDIYPATDGTVGTLTFNNDLNLNAGGSLRLDLSTSHLSGNDQVVVSGNLTVSSAMVVRIKALSGAANLSTAADYVLCSVAGTTTMATTPSLAWDGTPPANYLSFSVRTNGQNLVLHYTAATAPTVTATSSSATLVRNQKVTVTATVTPGTGAVTNVVADASQIGGSATAQLVLSGTPNVYTNTFTVASNTTPGVKLMSVVASANTGLSSPAYTVTNTVVVTNEVWTGAGANDNWTTSPNWSIASPASSGDAATFAGTTRLTPNLDANFSVTGVTFDASAGSFNLGTANSSTLTLTANGILNLSANPQTVNVPITLSGAQTFNAAAGNLTLSNTVDKAGNLVTVTGAANTVISGPISGSGSLFKRGSGILTVTTNATWDLAQASSAGYNGPLIAQAGTLAFKGGSVQTVTGELVVGGVIANGGPGNNTKMVVDGATLNVSTWLSVGKGNGTGTVSSDLVLTNGAIVTALDTSGCWDGGNGANKPKGSLTLSDTSSLTINNQFHVAEAGGANMTVNVNGTSTLSYGGFMDLAIGFGGTIANLNVNGGTVSCGGDPYIGHWGDGNATLTVNSGSFNVGTTGERALFMGYWDFVKGTININGGALNLWNNSKIRMARNINNAGNTFGHVINHNAGLVTFYSDGGVTPGGSGLLDMHFDAAATNVTSTYNLNGGTLDVPAIISTVSVGGRIFNFNGGTLKAGAAGSLMDLGTGNAHAYVRANGAIIDDNGNSVTIATALEHFSGDATDGGLTKKGAGVLYLTGANSYTGNSVVQAGTLQLAQAGLASSSSVSVSNAAILQLDFATTNQVAGLVLNGVAQAAGVYNNGTSPTYITGTGSLLVQPIASNPTNITFSASGGSLSLSWPTGHLGWILQAQTNSRALGLSTNWFDVPGSASVSSTNLPINPADPTVFYRLRKP